jgi:hypothetical protein
MTFGEFTTELRGAVDARVHLPPELALSGTQSGHDLVQGHSVADDHDVHVACRVLTCPGNRTKDEGDSDTVRDGKQRGSQNPGDPECLVNQAAQLLEDRTVAVCLEVGLAALHTARQDSGACKLLELALHRSRTEAQLTNDLSLIEPLVGMP